MSSRCTPIALLLTWLVATGCAAITPQQRLCLALDAAGMGLTADAQAEKLELDATLTAALDRACGAIKEQTATLECAERERARVLATFQAKHERLEKLAKAQQAAADAHAKDCGGAK